MKIVFMGSPEFAKVVLDKLNEKGINIICVYTQPPKPAGRGNKLTKTVAHQCAEALGIDVRCPAKLRKNQEELDYFKKLGCDLAIVVAYGLIIPEEYLDVPKYGFINVHPSDLPKFRGAAPIQRTLQSGDDTTALCIMQMDAGLDTGDVLCRTMVDIKDKPTFIELHDRLAKIGGEDLLKVIANIDSLSPEKQDDTKASYAHKIAKDEAKISSEDKLEKIERKFRAFNPWPGIYINIDGHEIKVHEAQFIFQETGLLPGSIIQEKKQIKIAFDGGYLVPLVLQRPGKSRANVKDFLNGFSIESKYFL